MLRRLMLASTVSVLALSAAAATEHQIENVDVVDARHIIVGNDNNLPFSTSRNPNMVDDNEFVLLEVESLLKAKQGCERRDALH